MKTEIKDLTTRDSDERQADLEFKAKALGNAIDDALNPDRKPGVVGAEGGRRHGFALLLFDFGDPPQPATYLSNGTRTDMIRVVEEWLARAKART